MSNTYSKLKAWREEFATKYTEPAQRPKSLIDACNSYYKTAGASHAALNITQAAIALRCFLKVRTHRHSA